MPSRLAETSVGAVHCGIYAVSQFVVIRLSIADLVLLGHFLQRVPLRDWTTRVREHVTPVSQFRPGRVATENDASDWLRRAYAIVVNHRQDERNLLQRAREAVGITIDKYC